MSATSGNYTSTLPAWWNVYGNLVTLYAQEFNVPLNIAAAVIQQESGGNPNAQAVTVLPNGTTVYANGLMQVLGGSFDPAQNIAAGMKQLGADIAQFGTTLGLAAYNAGAGNVQQYGSNILNPAYLLSQGWTVASGAFQPQAYVNAVTNYANQYATVLGPSISSAPSGGGSSGAPLPLPSPAIIPATQAGSQTPALAPVPIPAVSLTNPLSPFQAGAAIAGNAIKSVQRFFFIAVGLFFIGLGFYILLKAEGK